MERRYLSSTGIKNTLLIFLCTIIYARSLHKVCSISATLGSETVTRKKGQNLCSLGLRHGFGAMNSKRNVVLGPKRLVTSDSCKKIYLLLRKLNSFLRESTGNVRV